MRLAAQLKQGFYPIHPEVVRHWASLLRVDDPSKITILDPCAGKGEALATLAESLGVPEERCYAIELDEARGREVQERLPNAKVLPSTDALSAHVSNLSFSVVWCNPPFDDECGGGGREESSFYGLASRVLCPGGILGFVLPYKVLERLHDLQYTLKCWYEDLRYFHPLDSHAPYDEVVVTGRRKARGEFHSVVETVTFAEWPEHAGSYPVAERPGPKVFAKGGPTPLEVARMLEHSPGQRLLRPLPPAKPRRPLLPLSNGHASLLVASGQIDGVVHVPGEPPHVVRGMTKKEQVIVGTEQQEDKTVTTMTEKLVPVVRVLDATGEIRTFQ